MVFKNTIWVWLILGGASAFNNGTLWLCFITIHEYVCIYQEIVGILGVTIISTLIHRVIVMSGVHWFPYLLLFLFCLFLYKRWVNSLIFIWRKRSLGSCSMWTTLARMRNAYLEWIVKILSYRIMVAAKLRNIQACMKHVILFGEISAVGHIIELIFVVVVRFGTTFISFLW